MLRQSGGLCVISSLRQCHVCAVSEPDYTSRYFSGCSPLLLQALLRDVSSSVILEQDFIFQRIPTSITVQLTGESQQYKTLFHDCLL
jgi:hypothetical protein